MFQDFAKINRKKKPREKERYIAKKAGIKTSVALISCLWASKSFHWYITQTNEKHENKTISDERVEKKRTFVLDSPHHAHEPNGSIAIKTFSWNEAIQKVEFIPLITVCVECEVCFYRSACQEIKVSNVNTSAVGIKESKQKIEEKPTQTHKA